MTWHKDLSFDQAHSAVALGNALRGARQGIGALTLVQMAKITHEELGADSKIFADNIIDESYCPEGICDGSGKVPDYTKGDDGMLHQDGERDCPAMHV